ncbi:hypothetical protein QE364_003572 [Nocardioides zeae]|uniref:Uncharacterized protein n=1 Tax=Nocardioides zeae TaxID=1457234 RepID=A0ACC6IMA3_9ACTN|nr:condensation domain-containing protein [Nocardioides zeae]MDR6173870.1 hypothetical protein [Nocardioides zeae]MDR6211841.1 hypothetical protein [Nocardioides zeae]
MEYTELSAYPLPAGTTTCWTPRAGVGSWAPDPRELSYDHEAHLACAGAGSWIGSVLRMPFRYDAGALRRTLRAWTVRHEVLRTSVEPVHDASGRRTSWSRVTCPPDAVDVDRSAPVSGTADEARATVLAAFEQIGPQRWPHVLFASIEPEPGAAGPDDAPGFTLLFGADHSVMDAYSQLLWFDEVTALYERALAGDSDRELAALDVGSHVDFAAFDRRLGMLVSAEDQAVTAWRGFLGPELTFPAYPDPALARRPGDAPDGAVQHSSSTWVLDAERTRAVDALCRAQGTGLQSAVLGLLAGAVRRRTGATSTAFVLPLHTRHEPRYAGSVGWYVGLCPVRIDVADHATTADLVAAAHTAVRASKHLASRPFARVAQLLGVRDAPRFVVSYVDVRRVPGADRWDECQARTLRSAVPDGDEVYLWVIRSEHGLNVSARCPAGAVPAARLADLVACLGDLLDEAAGGAGSALVGATVTA